MANEKPRPTINPKDGEDAVPSGWEEMVKAVAGEIVAVRGGSELPADPLELLEIIVGLSGERRQPTHGGAADAPAPTSDIR